MNPSPDKVDVSAVRNLLCSAPRTSDLLFPSPLVRENVELDFLFELLILPGLRGLAFDSARTHLIPTREVLGCRYYLPHEVLI